MGNKHTLTDLYQMQALPLSAKIRMTKYRIMQWIEEYGEDGVYVSFSGGKDSTVLLDIVRQDYTQIPAVFVDVPTQYPELRDFAKTFDNVEIIKPKISFMDVCKKYSQVFMYLDPPYMLGTRSGKQYMHEMTDAEHEELLQMILQSRAKIMISGYETDMYNDYLSGWEKRQFSSCAEHGKPRIETVWMNYKADLQMNCGDFPEVMP